MSRRVALMALTGALLVGLIAAAWVFPVPYIAMSPGPARDVLGTVDEEPIIGIEGYEVYETDGKLDLTTVSATPASERLDLVGALTAWINPDVAVVPRSYLYPDDRTPADVEQINAEQMDTSQQEAVAAALRLLESDGLIDSSVQPIPAVAAIGVDSPALDKLRAGDVILAVDGEDVGSVEDVVEAVRSREPGSDVTITVRRDLTDDDGSGAADGVDEPGEPGGDEIDGEVDGGDETDDSDIRVLDVTITTISREDDPDAAAVGIEVGVSYEYEGEISFQLGRSIGGPSAGMVFALAIYDKLTPESLTGGQHIAGTGTIDALGRVGSIGGIQQKIVGAKNEGVSAFLVPAGNCEAALGVDTDDIELVRVETLSDAVEALGDLQADRLDKVPRC